MANYTSDWCPYCQQVHGGPLRLWQVLHIKMLGSRRKKGWKIRVINQYRSWTNSCNAYARDQVEKILAEERKRKELYPGREK